MDGYHGFPRRSKSWIKLISCALCQNNFIDNRGLSAHVRKEHEITWKEYKKKYPFTGVQVTEAQVTKVPEETKAPNDIHLNERMDRLETIVTTFFSGYTPTGNPSGITNFPGEEIEILGEKLNYKIALNPAIFSRYDKFKAVVLRRGGTWTGDFADFLDMSTKDILAVYGIYDTVVEFRDGRILFEVPAEMSGIG